MKRSIWQFQPIGVFHCAERYPYDAARQGVVGEATGVVRLDEGRGFEEALRDLGGFSRLWLVYVFHQNANWRPMVLPPRGRRKVGVFACRAPYRPNPIGISCVELQAVNGLEVHVRGHDLLDGTPILDIKPYLAYADSFPDATTGWLAETAADPLYTVAFEAAAVERVAWLNKRGVPCIGDFLRRQLERDPCSGKRKRIRPLSRSEGMWEIAYRTWRAHYRVEEGGRMVHIFRVESGYSAADLADSVDPHEDKATHREFLAAFA